MGISDSERPAWLIQFEPHSDLHARLLEVGQGVAETECEWVVDRYFHRMQAGDVLLFWLSGPGGGLLAKGLLLSAAYQTGAEPPAPWFIGFQIQGLLSRPIGRKALEQLPEWKSETFLKRPQGHVFRISPSAWQALEAQLPVLELPRTQVSPRKKLEQMVQKIRKEGLLLAPALIRRYHLALESASLVILTGPSGLGKSWLAQAYARHAGAHSCLLAVSPHWNQPEDWLGYFNPLQQTYFDSPASRFLREAAAEALQARRENRPARPYHLILDEMNLARVEHYFAPLLSATEVRRRGESAVLDLSDGSTLPLSSNLKLIGTINLDESTHLLADKIFDRAQVLLLEASRDDLALLLEGAPYQTLLIELRDCLEPLLSFAFRTLTDIQAYVTAAEALGIDWQTALDEQIQQKILARLRSANPADLSTLEAVQALLPAESFPFSSQRLASLRRQLLNQGFAFGS